MVSFITALENIKCLWVNVTKYVQSFYTSVKDSWIWIFKNLNKFLELENVLRFENTILELFYKFNEIIFKSYKSFTLM